jgi:hypothetical protein
MILASSCRSPSEQHKKPTSQPASQPSTQQPSSIPSSRSHLNEQLLTELSTVVPTEAGETESPDSVKRVSDLLAQGADINAKSPGAEPPIVLAASSGHIIALKMLLDRGADVNAQNDRGHTALMYAAHANDYVMAQLLLARGAKTDIKDEDGLAVLEWTEVPGGSTEHGYRQTLALIKRVSRPGFNLRSLKEPLIGPPTQRAILHRDNVRRLPLARSLEDVYALEEAIQSNRDLEALGMMQKGKFTMVPNDSEIELVETNLLHCRIKVRSSGRMGWVLCTWINRIR